MWWALLGRGPEGKMPWFLDFSKLRKRPSQPADPGRGGEEEEAKEQDKEGSQTPGPSSGCGRGSRGIGIHTAQLVDAAPHVRTNAPHPQAICLPEHPCPQNGTRAAALAHAALPRDTARHRSHTLPPEHHRSCSSPLLPRSQQHLLGKALLEAPRPRPPRCPCPSARPPRSAALTFGRHPRFAFASGDTRCFSSHA